MILIIANARIKGGLSGGDNIYLHLAEAIKSENIEFIKSGLVDGGEYLLPAKLVDGVEVLTMLDTDFKPFVLCYIWKIIKSIWKSLWDFTHYEYVYSASDFWMDSLPGFIYKLKGRKWVAGCYLKAPRSTFIYYWSQKIALYLMNNFADVICVTTTDVFGFKKPTIAVHGGIDLNDCYPGNEERIYDAVFVGRFHYTKGIDELIEIWNRVLKYKPNARLAIIGDGDTEVEKIRNWKTKGVNWLGYLGKERFDVYRKSKMVLYPTPFHHAHFSFGPIEAMACGCPMVAFNLDMMEEEKVEGVYLADNIFDFERGIKWLVERKELREAYSICAVDYAKTWDWSIRAPKILEEINVKLSCDR